LPFAGLNLDRFSKSRPDPELFGPGRRPGPESWIPAVAALRAVAGFL